MTWPWKRREELCKPKIRAKSKLIELETAKEILAEIFHARPADVEEMIQKRLEERNWLKEKKILLRETGRDEESELWPATFCRDE